MTRSPLLTTAALAALLTVGAAPAFAQDSGVMGEMRREQAGPATSWVPAQNQLAAQADAMGRQSARQWLAEADQAVQSGRTGQAMELLERSETRLLTRSTLASVADRPTSDPVITHIAAARQALMRRDRLAAVQSIATARDELTRMPREELATGAPAGAMPAMGGAPRRY